MTGKILILGASGHFGAHAAKAFQAAGHAVEFYRRGTSLTAAAKGARIIVNGLNPPNYHAWDRLIPEITTEVLSAAEATGATVLLPGNVYVYGKEPSPWGPDTPHRPVSRKGRIRAEMEARYRDAATRGTRTILLRAGDFIDPARPDGLFDRFVVGKAAKGIVTTFGDPEAAHTWAYLPDMTRAAVALAERGHDLPAFADIPFPGFSLSTRALADRIAALSGKPQRIKAFPWWAITGAAPFWELARELHEMRYLYTHPHSLDASTLARLLPDFSPTPLDEILAGILLPASSLPCPPAAKNAPCAQIGGRI